MLGGYTFKAYFFFEQLEEKLYTKRNGEHTKRKTPRFDLTKKVGNYPPLEKGANNKGEIFLNLITTDKNKNRSRRNTTPDRYLQCGYQKKNLSFIEGCKPASKTINITGLRMQFANNTDNVLVASGEPSNKKVLSGGVINPMYENRNDGFLFIFSSNRQVMEMFVISNGRAFIDEYRKKLALGHYDDEINRLRAHTESSMRG